MAVSKLHADKLEVMVLVAWLMKDFSWVLLMAQFAWPAALVAISLQFHTMMIEWRASSDAVNVHALAGLMWIVGNAIWMTAELLWDTSSSFDPATQTSVIPWHLHPLAGKNDQAYVTAVRCAQSVFCTAILMLLGFYALASRREGSTLRASTNPQEDSDKVVREQNQQQLVWGMMTQEVYAMIYIGPWLLKDLFWTLELLWPALLCSAIVFGLMADCLRRYNSAVSLVEMSWVIGNTIWIVGELGIKQPYLSIRLVAAFFLLLGVGLTSRVYKQALGKVGQMEVEDGITEETALIGRGSSSSPAVH